MANTPRGKQLLDSVFEVGEVELEQSKCLIPWCTKDAEESGYCFLHNKLRENSCLFDNKQEEQKFLEKTETKLCNMEGCLVYTSIYEQYCYRHEYQLKKYGKAVTNGDGLPYYTLYKDRAEIHVFSQIRKLIYTLTVDLEDFHHLLHRKFFISKDYFPYIYKDDGTTQSLANYVSKTEGQFFLYRNKNQFDVRAANRIPVSNACLAFILRSPDVGKSGYRGVYYSPYRKKWAVDIFQDIPERKIKEYFNRKEDALEFRNIVYKEVYGDDVIELLQIYKKEKPFVRKNKPRVR
jgi:hypothetical protein